MRRAEPVDLGVRVTDTRDVRAHGVDGGVFTSDPQSLRGTGRTAVRWGEVGLGRIPAFVREGGGRYYGASQGLSESQQWSRRDQLDKHEAILGKLINSGDASYCASPDWRDRCCPEIRRCFGTPLHTLSRDPRGSNA